MNKTNPRMILRFSRRESCLALTKLLTNQDPIVHVIRWAPKSTSTIKSNHKTMDTIDTSISEYYKQDSINKSIQKQNKLTQTELNKLRAAQHLEMYQTIRRDTYEKLFLSSYLMVCVDVGQINRAFNTLLKLGSSNKKKIVDVGHWNIVLKGWARLAAVGQILETRMHMLRWKTQPDSESFAYILLAYAKAPENRRTEVPTIIKHMRSLNIDARSLFQHAYLNPSERKIIIQLLKRHYDPNYEDVFCDEPIEYNCKLLENFDKTESRPNDFCGMSDLSLVDTWADNQRSVENKTNISIKSVASTTKPSKQASKSTKILLQLSQMWKESLTAALDQAMEALQSQSQDPEKLHLYPYLCTIDKTMLVDLMLDEVDACASNSKFSTSTKVLHIDLGTKVMTRYLKLKAIEDGSHAEKQKIYSDYLKEYLTDPILMSKMNSRQYIQQRAKETKNYAIYKEKVTSIEEWPHHVVAAVGRLMYGLILREIKFDPKVLRNSKNEIDRNNLVHAFYTAYFQIDCSHKIKEEFRAHQDFERLYEKATALRLKFDYSYLPCLVPPMPWLSRRVGGYLTNKTCLIRIPNQFAEQIHVTSKSEDNQKLYPSLDSLNAISLCPWMVNEEILDIVIQLFRAGGDTNLNVPLVDSKMNQSLPVLKENASKADRIIFNREKKRHETKRREMYSLWRDCLYRLSIANHHRDKIFWFPHNMDFRGRTYPVPPHFNHLGADLARSLLLFAKGEPLGEHGLDWLKVHLINLVGKMKSSTLGERLDYANSILHAEVLDSADNPWDGRRWWTQNENPWQVLACCKEIAKAIRSCDHRQYVSHFPVHQDGSCNGLQHYAALGRDPGGASAVNLLPASRPQDVYSRVVDIVEEHRQRDAANGVKVAQMLDGYIQRKVIKQTVMTTVYGVTKFGARHQIAKQLSNKGYNENEIWRAANYLTGKTFDAIGNLFIKSRLIQDWLNDCAFTIASRCRQHVCWETPLGLPVRQPYTVPSYTNFGRILSPLGVTNANSNSSSKWYHDPMAPLNAAKQKTAFPPNFIHSLDSSHMMLTSLHCQRQGLTFVSVHDCYWTHASTVDVMNKICRQQFVDLHSQPILQDLSEQFIFRYGKSLEQNPETRSEKEKKSKSLEGMLSTVKDAKQVRARLTFADVPATGDLDLKKVHESTYFFS